MKDREYRTLYKGMRVRQELRASQDEDTEPLIRAKRKGCPLKNAGWFDDHIVSETSWKDKRKTKYHVKDIEWLEIMFHYDSGPHYTWGYYEYQQKLEALGYYVRVTYIGKYPYKSISLRYKGTKIRIPKNAEYIT